MADQNDPLQFTASGGATGASATPSGGAPAQDDDPLLHVSNRGRSGMPAPYPDMTPGVPAKPLMGTSWNKIGTEEYPGGSTWDDGVGRLLEAGRRVSTEMNQTYQDTPPLLTPAARAAVDNWGWLGRNVAGPAVDAGSFVAKEGSALGSGALAAASELLSGGNPRLARDVHAALTVAPVLQTGAPPFAAPIVAREPSYTGPLAPRDVTPPPGAGTTPPGQVGPLYPPEALPTKTPGDVLKIYQGQKTAALGSNAQLAPQFTKDWTGSLDQYRNQTPAALAREGPNATTDLVDQLQRGQDAPLDNIQSIQEVDQIIQRAISKQYGTNGLSPEGVQMRQILRDFRDRYENVPADQMSGSPQGIQDFANSRNTYAAYSRMKELQGVVDSTEGNPNRASLIASRVNGFLNDDANVRGWSPDEIAQARKAANSGYMQEWMRAEGSRLVGIGAAVALPGVGKLLGVPAQVGLSYAVRNAAETARLAQVQKALGVLGQRVEQPGTVPPQPQPVIPRQGYISAARYAPLVGLLGSSADQPRDQPLF